MAEPSMGYNAATGEFVDMVKGGIIDPLKVRHQAHPWGLSIAIPTAMSAMGWAVTRPPLSAAAARVGWKIVPARVCVSPHVHPLVVVAGGAHCAGGRRQRRLPHHHQ